MPANQVDHHDEVVNVTVSTSFAPSRLDKAVDRFQSPIGTAMVEIIEDGVPVAFDRVTHCLHRLKPAVRQPPVQSLQTLFGRSPAEALIDFLQSQLHTVGPGRLKVPLAQVFKKAFLYRGQVRLVLQPNVTAVLEILHVRLLLAAQGVSGPFGYSCRAASAFVQASYSLRRAWRFCSP